VKVIADVVIVGAGVMGCCAAFHLARQGGLRVIVVEKGSIGSGMTKRSGALVRTHFPNEPEARLALASLRFFQNWKDRVGGNCGFAQTSLVLVVRGESNATQLQKNVTMLQGVGINTQTVSRDELRELQPAARVDDVALAAYEPEAGYADPIATTQSLAARAREMGVTFKTGTFVRTILVDRGCVIGVDTTTGKIEAPTVVVMAGPWSDRLLKPLGVEIGIRPERVQVAFFDRPPELKSGHAAYIDAITRAFFRPHTFGLTLGGPSARKGKEPPNPDHFDEAVEPEFIAEVQQRIAARLRAMANAKFVRGHAGAYDTSPDSHAVLGRAPGVEGLVIAAGFSGNGFCFAPAVGACIAELIGDGAASTVDLHPFRLTRFQENQPLKNEEYTYFGVESRDFAALRWQKSSPD
jgi:sarcosine oxidase subunit beta